MRIVVNEFISLDGVVQAPGGKEEDTDAGFEHGGWSMRFFDPEAMGPEFDEMTRRADALLYGRRTWRVMADAWPKRPSDPFADWINAVQKYVVTNTLSDADIDWQPTTRISGDNVVDAIGDLRSGQGGEVHILGSAQLVRTLMANDLVDELRLMIEPVVLGGGKGIFPSDGSARSFELASTKTTGTGVNICHYRRAGS